jgi:2-polyprenyl-3-methyl-5-hydroxy-6-metoxy-1,4-benzoquinol methylase
MEGEIWEDIWSSDSAEEHFLEWLARDSHSARTEKINRYIEKHTARPQDPDVLELGSGMGVYSFIFGKNGARVTLLDSNKTVLDKAKAIFDKEGIKAKFLLENAFHASKKVETRFDIVMSFGFVEHFKYPERYAAIKAHYDLLRAGGVLIISVPNLLFFPHEAMKLFLTIRKKWRLGYERSFSRIELAKIAKKLKLKNPKIIGSSFIYDFRKYLRIYRTSSIGRRLFGEAKGKNRDRPLIFQNGDKPHFFFDDFLGADIVLLGIK